MKYRTESDGRQDYGPLEKWLALEHSAKPINLRFLDSAIRMGFDPFRECVGGLIEDGSPSAHACDKYPLIGELQCPACQRGICGLCGRNPTPFPHGRTICTECSDGVVRRVNACSP